MIHWKDRPVSGEMEHWAGFFVEENGTARVELRKSFARNGKFGQMLIVITGREDIRMSANGTIPLTFAQVCDMDSAIIEALEKVV